MFDDSVMMRVGLPQKAVLAAAMYTFGAVCHLTAGPTGEVRHVLDGGALRVVEVTFTEDMKLTTKKGIFLSNITNK